ncbi:MAG: prohibitin family protein [Candidatus Omnitrophica bacterium]|nr:prohibitin family protein [Candidatus Omnitrophota bacterium]
MRKLLFIVFLVCVSPLLSGCMPHSTGSTEVGVRTVKWSPFAKSGVIQEVYAPGATYFFPPFVNDWHVFDTKLRNMEMTLTRGRGARQGRDDLVFKTIDGNDISLDVIISYRVDPPKAPYILEYVASDNLELEERVVRPIARNVTRDLFGEFTSEDFYVTAKRTETAQQAIAKLNDLLNPYGVIVETVLPKDYRFPEAYQKAIEDKKVADQMAQRYRSEIRATEEHYRQKLEEAQGEVNKLVARADGEFKKATIQVDAYFEQQGKIAQAIKAEGEAESEGIRKMIEALKSSGGTTMVKLKIADALQGKRIMLLPFGGQGGLDLKTTDVNDLLKTYGLKKLSE